MKMHRRLGSGELNENIKGYSFRRVEIWEVQIPFVQSMQEVENQYTPLIAFWRFAISTNESNISIR